MKWFFTKFVELDQNILLEGICSWCGQNEIDEGGVRGHVEAQGSGPAKVFCSDVCYSQCRRAAFKRAKVCDWCKHVRHTVSYVDLHDGQRQLQFCTDKCRNQYKMHLFCAEATSLGVQSCTTTPVTMDETSPGTSIDLKHQPTASRLITPDLWLQDCQLDNQLNVKLESNEEQEVTSIGSETDEQGLEVPLNLVHSSRRHKVPVKRKPSLVETRPSRKGKSHRKVRHPEREKAYKNIEVIDGRSSPEPLAPKYPTTAWPSFPYPPHIVHPSFNSILQSQLLALNHSVKPKPMLESTNQDNKSPSKSFTESCNSVIVTKSEIPLVNPGSEIPKIDHATKDSVGEGKVIDDKVNLNSSLLSPNFIVLRIPLLVPLPIPVPIPIPLNIHEKYLKHVLT